MTKNYSKTLIFVTINQLEFVPLRFSHRNSFIHVVKILEKYIFIQIWIESP